MEGDKIITGIGNLHISNETLFEIFEKLPAKSLMRFRCVSKYFCSLTSESSFVEAHYKSFVTQFLRGHCIYNISPEDGIKKDEDFANCPIRYLDEPCFRELDCLRFVNGLVCLWNHHGHVAICNPFIKEHVFLPKVQSASLTNYLFGFDPTTRKHKVLVGHMVYNQNITAIHAKYSVFTVGVDKSWREMPGLAKFITMRNYVCIEGVIYSEDVCKLNVVVFSIVGDEKQIRTISLPDEISFKRNTIVEIKGQVATLVHDKDFDQGIIRKISVYILNGTSETEAWVKHIIELPSELTRTSSFTTNPKGEIIWIPDFETSYMLLYDVELKGWTKVKIHKYCKRQCCNTYPFLLHLAESIWPLR